MRNRITKALTLGLITTLVAACANIGRPDGGPYDETPPVMLGSTPAPGATGVHGKRVKIEFDEYINIENASEKIVVSPPQQRQPVIEAVGKHININFEDTLRDSTTYTIDFSDAIVDNNEANPLENFVFTFSTGDVIDTMEVSGAVLNAENLEPVKGMLVGLYSDLADSAFTTKKMERIGRTDSRGRFCIKGIKPGQYRIYALNDNDQNYMFSQKSENLAFLDSVIIPSSFPDVRYDTTWVDTVTIDTIIKVDYTHFVPDDIVLKAFQEDYKTQTLLKNDRADKRKFTLYFNTHADSLPQIEGLNFDTTDAFIIEPSAKNDTISYWLRDSLIYNVDTLRLAVTYTTTDSLARPVKVTDTINTVTKKTFERKSRRRDKDEEEQVIPSLSVNLESLTATFDGYKDITAVFEHPLASYDREAMHIMIKADSTYDEIPFNFLPDTSHVRTYRWVANWEAGREYKLTVDSGTIRSIYGLTNKRIDRSFKIRAIEEYGMIVFNIKGLDGQPAYAELLNKNDSPIRKVTVEDGEAVFNYLPAGEYYARLCIDTNNNGEWDTGNYEEKRQAEEVFYYNAIIDLKAMWTIEQDWDLHAIPADKQKPLDITKQKPEVRKKKTRTRTYQGN